MRNTAHGPRFPIIGKSELGYPAPKRLEADGMLNKRALHKIVQTVLKLIQVGQKVMVEFILRNSAKCPCKFARRGARYGQQPTVAKVSEKRGHRLFTKNIAFNKRPGARWR